MHTSTLSNKGWIVIPQDLRKRYGLKKGDKVHIIDYGGVISVVPVSAVPVTDSLGMLKGETSLLNQLLNSRRQDAIKGK